MNGLTEVKKEITKITRLLEQMFETTQEGFMKNKLEPLKEVLRKEESVNELERKIVAFITQLSKSGLSESDQKRLRSLAEVIGDLERIGDLCEDIVERVEIKIWEKLYFSDEAVKEYGELYGKVKVTLEQVFKGLAEENRELAQRGIKGAKEIPALVERFKRAHSERLIKGICTPRAANFFVDMLEFMGQISNHAVGVAKKIRRKKIPKGSDPFGRER